MKCTKCNAEVEENDNFCSQCGEWTAKGYNFLKDESNIATINKGGVVKQNKRLTTLTTILSLGIILFVGMLLIQGKDLFKPLIYLKKQVVNYVYGYQTSVIKTNNQYGKEIVDSYDDAIEFIKKDFSKQVYTCNNDTELRLLEYNLEEDYQIPSVLFCDVDYDEAKKIDEVIRKMYSLFPKMQGYLTNITITNAETNSEYIAYFQPMYQFVNVKDSLNKYNKVNKTQILLNSYYYLNKNILDKGVESVVGENYYVKDATFESAIAHELGHYLTFAIYLKENNIDSITYLTKENEYQINNAVEEFESGEFASGILDTAINNYNQNYNVHLSKEEFASTISKYAGVKNKEDEINALETIAEAVHDYYLHGYNLQKSSLEIIRILNEKLGDL